MKKSLIFFGAAALCAASGIMMAQSQINQNHKLRMAEAAISQFYVDTVNESKLVEDAIKGMLEVPTLTPNTPTRKRHANSTSLSQATSAALELLSI